jgi:multidrug efflux pump subunit AcrA (membrane-fusion protein)
MINNVPSEIPSPDPLKSDPGLTPVESKSIFRHRRGDGWMIFGAVVSIVFACGFMVFAIWPQYKDPISRLYSTRLGYGAVARDLDQPFPVKSTTVTKKKLASSCQGEGTVSSEPVLVPVVPVARVTKVYVNVGDTVKKGQLLAEIDDRFQQVKVAEAKAAVDSALSEQERVLVTTAQTTQFERPDLDKIHADTAKASLKLYDELVAIDRALAAKDYVSKRDLLLDQVQQVLSEGNRREAEYLMKVGDKGAKEALTIAANTVLAARQELKARQMELEDYKVYAPCDGVVERRFLHEREFSQAPGTPAFLIDESGWFEARMDQTTLGQFAVGDRANVFLQAFPEQTFTGVIERIVPIVTYDLAGPRATRPIRPLGTGAPEWPSTYAVRVKLDAAKLPVVPGLTGFARVCPEKEVVAVPVEALFARSGRTAMVYVVGDDSYSPRKVTFGASSDGWVEITSGLEPGCRVLSEGFQLLRPDDRIELTHVDGQSIQAAALKFAK